MKKLVTALMLLACVTAAEHIEGYPVYKLVTLGPITYQFLGDLKKEDSSPEPLPDDLRQLIPEYEQLLQEGFENHYAIQLIKDDKSEITVFIPDTTHATLWEKSPHDLAKQNKTHRLSIDTLVTHINNKALHRATNTVITTEDRQPVVRK